MDYTLCIFIHAICIFETAHYHGATSFVSSQSFRKGALTQTNRKSSLCLSYLEEQLAKSKSETEQVKKKKYIYI